MEKKKAAVWGWPIQHSLSPPLHGYWLAQYKINGSYEKTAVLPEKLEENLRALSDQGFSGVNLTLPHKEAALKMVDQVDPLAQRVGAINTVIVRENGILEGLNTDLFGFTQNLLSAGFKKTQQPVIILGAGGAARAAIVALQELGISDIRIVNRTQERAEQLAQEFSLRVFEWENRAASLENGSLLVNTTCLGLEGQPSLDLDLSRLPIEALVMDMVYRPLRTDLLKQAAARGNPVLDGLGMLLHQARPAFKAFFGVDPEVTGALRDFVLEEAK